MPSLTLPSAVGLARTRFALTVVWHFLFLAFTIGLAVLEGRWLATGKAVYLDRVAAMERHFETQSRAPALIVGWPDAATGETRGAIGIPGLASLYLTHDLYGTVTGLKDMPRATWPTNLPLVFWSFQVMVGLGLLRIALGLASLWLRAKGRLYDTAWFQRFAVAMGPSGLIAVTAGWTVTETGRQPFTVYGLLRTTDSVSPVAAPRTRAASASSSSERSCSCR